MPSAMNGDSSVHSTSPELGSAPVASGAGGSQTEALKQVLTVIEKKVRNMEKKKGKLEDYQSKKNRGENLNADQLDALAKSQEVTHNLDFARELQKNFLALGIDLQKAERKACRREQLRREQQERRRLQRLLEVQLLLDQLGEEAVREELRRGDGDHGDHPILTSAQLIALDNFYKLLNPERDASGRLAEQFEEASVHMWELLEGKDKPVVGTTYKALKETVDRVLQSGYFQRTHTHQNGVCEEELSLAAAAAVAPSESSEADEEPEPAVAEGTPEQDYTEDVVDTKEFVNMELVPQDSHSSTQEEPASEWNQEAEVSLHTQQQPPPSEAPPTSADPTPPVSVAADPVVRKQVVQDLMAQMQGTYNFMQESVLEYDGPAMDPAIVSVQSMSPARNLERAQMVHSEAQLLSQPSAVPSQPEVSLLSSPPEDFSSAAPLYPTPHTSDPLQASLSLSSEQPASTALHTGGINVNAAPFQSMTAVFNLNAPPMPSANEVEQQKLSSQYQSSFSPSYSSQSAHSEEQTDMQPVVGSFHSQEALQAGAAHQSLSQQAMGQGAGFNRAGQPFYVASRGGVMSRGAPRAPRGAVNGYRGGYDGYRPPFPSAAGGNYGQTQFGNAPREYSNNTYQRDGYQQQGYKRGAGQGSRGVSRGRGGPFRYSRGMTAHQTS
ncbi:caprin-1-like isoform X1 [Alosa sapidissima]|uniref:caprin-1-like isoform X1 n=1 Tax=Alosa sapidissima TaxID=34773 RepID=UPI001C0A026D|nr:caprin-1-like isoform X1 [Alosa sapidissima]XP_041931210.1 caprin-1-like isoform X1 [Alosa sapidissima]